MILHPEEYFLFISIPCIRMPAYDNNAWSSLFFVIFIVVCMYIFVSIFLAVVYKNYRKHMKVSVLRCMLSALEVSFLYNIML